VTIEWVTEQAPAGRPAGRRRTVAIAAIAMFAVVGIGFGVARASAHNGPSPVPVLAVSGAVVLRSDYVTVSVGSGTLTTCLSSGPLVDIRKGAPVTVTADRRVVGATRLSAGQLVVGACRFAFRLAVPASGAAYDVRIGNRVVAAVAQRQLASVVRTLG
jgi:hypothetical protein